MLKNYYLYFFLVQFLRDEPLEALLDEELEDLDDAADDLEDDDLDDEYELLLLELEDFDDRL